MGTKSIVSRIFSVLFLLAAPFFLIGGLVAVSGHAPQLLFEYYILNRTPTHTETVWSNESYQDEWAARALLSLEEDILGLEEDTYSGYYRNNASRMLYYAKNLKTGEVITNCSPISFSGSGADMTMDEFERVCHAGQNGSWVNFSYFDGVDFYPWPSSMGKDEDTGFSRFSREAWDETRFGIPYKEIGSEYAGTYEIAFAFSESYAINGILLERDVPYTPQELQQYLERTMLAAGCFLVGVLLLLLHLAGREGRIMVAGASAKVMHLFPLELKAGAFLFLLVLFGKEVGYLLRTELLTASYPSLLLFLLFFLAVYLTAAEMIVCRSGYLKHSIIYWCYAKLRKDPGQDDDAKPRLLSKAYRRMRRELRSMKKREREKLLALPYQRRLHRTLLKYLFGILCCLLWGVLLWHFLSFLAIPFFAGGIIGLTYWFYRRYVGVLEDIERIAVQIRLLRSGSFDQKLFLPQNSQLLSVAADLNNLQDGLKSEIDKRMVSEKMKVELITNVSHDLKTPLTSMINYIDLLQSEQLQPDHANAYVRVLDQKAKRLKLLIENIFDISKAASGNMVVNYEKLSMSELVNQTLAECDDGLEKAQLSFKKNFAEEKFYVYADGKMLWRVTENVINNAVKYSLKGTRIYLELTQGKEFVCFTVKNIAGYEMNFTADSIVERFVRGDESRTTEGTGLGLSIVKTFTEAMGGRVNVIIDGDLFKICVCVKRYREGQEIGEKVLPTEPDESGAR